MTNGDRIRSMTDEELADFLTSDDVNACTHCKLLEYAVDGLPLPCPCRKDGEVPVFLKWLSSETTECKN